MGEARPAWKVLRVLGNLTDSNGFDYLDSAEVREATLSACKAMQPDNALGSAADMSAVLQTGGIQRVGGVPMYGADAMTRRSPALQHTPDAWANGARVGAALASSLNLVDGDSIKLAQGDDVAEISVSIDEGVPDDCVWLPTTVAGSESLGLGFGAVTLEKI